MSTSPIATRLPKDLVDHVEAVAESPATKHQSKSAVVREIVVEAFEEQ